MTKGKEKQDRGKVEISQEECKGCGLCVAACPVAVLKLGESLNSRGYHSAYYVGVGCTGCGACFYTCPEPGAITVLVFKEPKVSVEKEPKASAEIEPMVVKGATR